MYQRARRHLVALEPGVADPVGKAVAAEAGKTHQLYVLGIVTMAQMAPQPAEGRGRGGIVKRIEGIGSGHVQAIHAWCCRLPLP